VFQFAILYELAEGANAEHQMRTNGGYDYLFGQCVASVCRAMSRMGQSSYLGEIEKTGCIGEMNSAMMSMNRRRRCVNTVVVSPTKQAGTPLPLKCLSKTRCAGNTKPIE